MKHYICETHLPKDGSLKRYLGVDAETKREAYVKFKDLLDDGEYIPTHTIQSIGVDKIKH